MVSPRRFALLGIGLIVLSLLIDVVSLDLLGQQQSEALAAIPTAVFTGLSWLGSLGQSFGVALVVAALLLRALRATWRPQLRQIDIGGPEVADREHR